MSDKEEVRVKREGLRTRLVSHIIISSEVVECYQCRRGVMLRGLIGGSRRYESGRRGRARSFARSRLERGMSFGHRKLLRTMDKEDGERVVFARPKLAAAQSETTRSKLEIRSPGIYRGVSSHTGDHVWRSSASHLSDLSAIGMI